MKCTICKSENTKFRIQTKDYSISHEKFDLYDCLDCKNTFTANPPTEQEIGPYYESDDYVSHSETQKGIINKLYHRVREISLKNKIQLIRSLTNGIDLLDYGCGAGEFLHYANNNGYNSLGVEPAPSARQIAEKKGVQTLEPNALDQLETKSRDVITLWHVLEHVHKLGQTLNLLNHILKDDGYLIIAVPNITSWDSKHYGQYWAALDVPRHLYHFTPSGIINPLAKGGFKLIEEHKMPFDSFYVSLLSEKYKSKYPKPVQMLTAFINGYRSNQKNSGKNQSSKIYIFKKS